MAEIPTITSRRSLLACGLAFGAAAISTPIQANAIDPDKALKHLCAEHRDAVQRHREVSDRSRDASAMFKCLRPDIPSALFWREEDRSSGLSVPGAIYEGRPYFAPRDLAEIELLDGFRTVFTASRDDGTLAITERRVMASDEWRARRDALVSEIRNHAALNEAAKAASGVEAMEDRQWAALCEVDELTRALAEVSAKTGAGLAEKARCALSVDVNENLVLWRSVVEDAAAIGGGLDLDRASA